MKILVLQHVESETPGYIKDLMLKDGFDLTTVELDVGEKIPENIDPKKVKSVTTSFSLPGFNLSTFCVADLIFV